MPARPRSRLWFERVGAAVVARRLRTVDQLGRGAERRVGGDGLAGRVHRYLEVADRHVGPAEDRGQGCEHRRVVEGDPRRPTVRRRPVVDRAVGQEVAGERQGDPRGPRRQGRRGGGGRGAGRRGGGRRGRGVDAVAAGRSPPRRGGGRAVAGTDPIEPDAPDEHADATSTSTEAAASADPPRAPPAAAHVTVPAPPAPGAHPGGCGTAGEVEPADLAVERHPDPARPTLDAEVDRGPGAPGPAPPRGVPPGR